MKQGDLGQVDVNAILFSHSIEFLANLDLRNVDHLIESIVNGLMTSRSLRSVTGVYNKLMLESSTRAQIAAEFH